MGEFVAGRDRRQDFSQEDRIVIEHDAALPSIHALHGFACAAIMESAVQLQLICLRTDARSHQSEHEVLQK